MWGTQPLHRLPCMSESRAKSTKSITIPPSKSHKTPMTSRKKDYCCFFSIPKTVKLKWPDHSQAISLLCGFFLVLNKFWSRLRPRNGALQFSYPEWAAPQMSSCLIKQFPASSLAVAVGFNLFLQGSDKVTPDFTKCAKSSDPSFSPVQEPWRLRWGGRRAGWSSMLKFTTWDFCRFWSVSQSGPHCSSWLFPWIRGSQFFHPMQPVSLILCCENSSFAIKFFPPVSLFCPSFFSPFTFS